ncbi:MAG: hypothetical protein J6I64_07820, partial [Lachnospiraceae bacterium]|nr:hypothetical protein [Lachnospiraceae bacterium]
MAKILDFMEHRDEWIEERYDLIRERMDGVVSEDMAGLYCENFLRGMAHFLYDALRVYDLQTAQMLDVQPLEKQRGIHDQLYEASIWQEYGTLSDACWKAGEEWGPLLWAAAQEWGLAAGYACTGQRFLLTITVELFLQVYQLFEMERDGELRREELMESVRQAVYSHFSDYCDVIAALVYHEQFYPGEFHHQLLDAGAEDLYGLYRLGGQVDEWAEARCELLSSTDEDRAAYKNGLVDHIVTSLQQIGSDKKRIVIYVPAGYERLAQILYHRLTEAGFIVVCLRRQETFMARIIEFRQAQDLPELPLFWDRGLEDRRLTEEKNALDTYRSFCQERLTVLDLDNLGIYGMQAEENAEDVGADEARLEAVAEEEADESTICLTLTQKQEHLYEEF